MLSSSDSDARLNLVSPGTIATMMDSNEKPSPIFVVRSSQIKLTWTKLAL